jgi:hypothetical protein
VRYKLGMKSQSGLWGRRVRRPLRISRSEGSMLRRACHEFNLLQIKSVVAVAKKVEARNDGRSPKEHVEPESIVTSKTVIHSRDKEHDWTDLREQSHMEQPTLPCEPNIGPSGLPPNWVRTQKGKRPGRSRASLGLGNITCSKPMVPNFHACIYRVHT